MQPSHLSPKRTTRFDYLLGSSSSSCNDKLGNKSRSTSEESIPFSSSASSLRLAGVRQPAPRYSKVSSDLYEGEAVSKSWFPKQVIPSEDSIWGYNNQLNRSIKSSKASKSSETAPRSRPCRIGESSKPPSTVSSLARRSPSEPHTATPSGMRAVQPAESRQVPRLKNVIGSGGDRDVGVEIRYSSSSGRTRSGSPLGATSLALASILSPRETERYTDPPVQVWRERLSKLVTSSQKSSHRSHHSDANQSSVDQSGVNRSSVGRSSVSHFNGVRPASRTPSDPGLSSLRSRELSGPSTGQEDTGPVPWLSPPSPPPDPAPQISCSGRRLMQSLLEDLASYSEDTPTYIQTLDPHHITNAFKPLITFTHQHSDQVSLWVEAFNHWDDFIGSILSTLNTSSGLQPEDGAQVLNVLPTPILLYVYRKRYKPRLFPELPLEARQLCMTPHISQMSLTLVSVLAASTEYMECSAVVRSVTEAVRQLGSSKVLKEVFKNIRIFVNSFPKAELNPTKNGTKKVLDGSARLSLYTLLRVAHDSSSIERFLQSWMFMDNKNEAVRQLTCRNTTLIKESNLLQECQSQLSDEVEATVTRTSLFLGGLGSCLAMHLTSLQALEDSLDNEIARLRRLEEDEKGASEAAHALFKSFEVKAPPFSAVSQLRYISSLVEKLNAEYSAMQRCIAEVVGKTLGITEYSVNHQGPPPPVSMLLEGLLHFIKKVDKSVAELLVSLNLSGDVTRSSSGSAVRCLPTIADFFGMCDDLQRTEV
eukprot:Blabericola_migrator_1__4043@NODE_222_length_11195_cov_65_275341_g188_i0_p2_GENE_NODE_222_length_11195_cov_65_275341_g188_i0NODE_222_length_11195_cov_65_275341_g188_i0_p2_ORF_typecomplete_len762_score109_86DUF4455/PF14643_6/0_0025DUF1192/PF06698_11/0_11JAKMIP_CC3/PF16034_5/14JAKMIP_CC3/PF16034_5/8_9e03JAKMIP_CC3/PF16034_5/22_NODE_222_length_11195_cov_65_275341_g188_i01462431